LRRVGVFQSQKALLRGIPERPARSKICIEESPHVPSYQCDQKRATSKFCWPLFCHPEVAAATEDPTVAVLISLRPTTLLASMARAWRKQAGEQL
jgi:hypothetical protein